MGRSTGASLSLWPISPDKQFMDWQQVFSIFFANRLRQLLNLLTFAPC